MRTSAFAAILLVCACGAPEDPTATASTTPANPPIQTPGGDPPAPPAPASGPASAPSTLAGSLPADLSGRLDCLRSSGGVLLIGHRGGPTRDYPENAMETFARTLKAGTPGMEIDIATTKDGVLVLMHDDDLDRTTTGQGLVSDHTWDEVSKLKLETYSKATAFSPPKLDDALAWAVKNNVLLELDKKKSTAFDPVIAAIRAAKAENNVFLITYSDDQAIEVHKKAPDLVITASVDSVGQLDNLLSKGVNAEHLVAWTGTSDPDSALWKALAARGIESAFGTLGPRNSSLDGKYWQDDDGSEYDQLVSSGLPILVTDLTDKVSRQLAPVKAKSPSCGF
jgi:glycerophosphoryl diester phosphodiesterase